MTIGPCLIFLFPLHITIYWVIMAHPSSHYNHHHRPCIHPHQQRFAHASHVSFVLVESKNDFNINANLCYALSFTLLHRGEEEEEKLKKD